MRFQVFDSIKGVAIMSIFVMHIFSYVPYQTHLTDFFKLGSIGVQVFFILSGYIMMHKYKYFGDYNSVKKFYFFRFIKIYPIFLFFIFLNLTVFGFTERKFSYGNLDWVTVLNNISLFAGFSYKSNNAIVDGSWFIFSILLAYFLFPIINRKNTKWSSIILYYVLIRVLALVIVIINIKIYPYSGDDKEFYLISSFNYYFPVNHLSEFLLGILLYKIMPYWRQNKDLHYWVFYFLFLLFTFYFSKSGSSRLPINVAHSFCALFFIIGSIKMPLKYLNNIFWSYLGSRSLSIFLNHMLIIHLLNSFLFSEKAYSVNNFLILGLLSIFSSIVFGEITYFLFEKKLNQYLKLVGSKVFF